MKNINTTVKGIKKVINIDSKSILPRLLIEFNNELKILAIKYSHNKFRLAILDADGERTDDYFHDEEKGRIGGVWRDSALVNNYVKELAQI